MVNRIRSIDAILTFGMLFPEEVTNLFDLFISNNVKNSKCLAPRKFKFFSCRENRISKFPMLLV